MDIDLGQDVVFNVKLNDKEYKLREPSALEVEKYQVELKKDEDSATTLLISFVSSLGMDKDVASAMGIRKLTKLMQGIIGVMNEKSNRL